MLIESAGKDATADYDFAGHSDDATDMLRRFEIGALSGWIKVRTYRVCCKQVYAAGLLVRLTFLQMRIARSHYTWCLCPAGCRHAARDHISKGQTDQYRTSSASNRYCWFGSGLRPTSTGEDIQLASSRYERVLGRIHGLFGGTFRRDLFFVSEAAKDSFSGGQEAL